MADVSTSTRPPLSQAWANKSSCQTGLCSSGFSCSRENIDGNTHNHVVSCLDRRGPKDEKLLISTRMDSDELELEPGKVSPANKPPTNSINPNVLRLFVVCVYRSRSYCDRSCKSKDRTRRNTPRRCAYQPLQSECRVHTPIDRIQAASL